MIINGTDACDPIFAVLNADRTDADGGNSMLRVYRNGVMINKSVDTDQTGLYIGFVGNDQVYVQAEGISPYSWMFRIDNQGLVSFGGPGDEDWTVAMPAEFKHRVSYPITEIEQEYTMGSTDLSVVATDITNLSPMHAWREAGPAGSGSFTDITAAVALDDASAVAPYAGVAGARFYVGFDATFANITVKLAVNGSPSIAPTFEYSQGTGTWNTFTPTDGTAGFVQDGTIAWSIPALSGWATDTILGQGPYYWVRIERTTVSMTTDAEVNRARVLPTDGTGNPRTVTLPAAGGAFAPAGRIVKVKDGTGSASGAFPVKVAAQGGDLLDNAAFQLMTQQRESWTIQTNGVDTWYIT